MLPESPRYLLIHGQMKEATSVLEVMVKSNKTSLPEGTLEEPEKQVKHWVSGKLCVEAIQISPALC